MKYKAFVSYNREDKPYKDVLYRTLQSVDGVTPLVDESRIPPGTKVWLKISDMLDEADCFIAVITEKSIKSHSVLQEIVRAHDRKLLMIYFIDQSVPKKDLPDFIKEVHYISFQGLEDFIGKVNDEVEDTIRRESSNVGPFTETKQLLGRCSRRILSFENQQQLFRVNILNEILGTLATEIDDVSGKYTIDIGIEQNFLVRAKPLFESANSVYATSLANVSTFWKKENTNYTRDYIKSQPADTKRLFVFNSPSEAHAHLEILKANNVIYGDTNGNFNGAVLVCSLESYKRLLASFTDKESKQQELLHKDFGILHFDNCTIEATLDQTELVFNEISFNHRGVIDYEKHKEIFDNVSTLRPGEIHKEFNILKFSLDFVDDRAAWANRLKTLFGTKEGSRSGDVYHMVFFSQLVDEGYVVKTKHMLLEKREELGVSDVWFGTRFALPVVDSERGGCIDTGSNEENPYMLLMRFPDTDALEKFYQHKTHSDIRQEIYQSFSGTIDDLYKQMDHHNKDDRLRKLLYENAEQQVKSRYMERRDYLDTENIDDLVLSSPFTFGI